MNNNIQKPNNLCIIPARGGSKRIPRKNIRDFLGKPIIAYSIEAAIESGLFQEVMVSTDDLEIAEVAKKYGAKVPFMRSAKNSDDYAGLGDVVIEILRQYETKNVHFESICCILPTSPLISYKKIIEAYKLYTENKYDTVFPVVAFSYPILRALKIENKQVSMIWPENLKKRSQDLITAYHDSGQFYWLKTDKFIETQEFWPKNSGAIILDELHVQDIDNDTDWKIAEIKFRMINGK